jgi:hypothetical protein
MAVEGAPYLASILLGRELLHVLPYSCIAKAHMEDGPILLQVSEEVRDKRSIGLEGLVFVIVIGIIGQDGGASYCLLTSGGTLGVLSPEERVIILVLRDELMSNDINKQDTCRAPNVGQNGLYLLKRIGGRGCIKGYGNVIRLLVIICPGLFKALLFFECIDHHNCGLHKWFSNHTNLMQDLVLVLNSLSAKSVLVGEKLVATYSIST